MRREFSPEVMAENKGKFTPKLNKYVSKFIWISYRCDFSVVIVVVSA